MAQTHIQTHLQTDMATLRPTQPRGAELVKTALDGADKQTDRRTDRRTWRLLDQLGQEGPVGENNALPITYLPTYLLSQFFWKEKPDTFDFLTGSGPLLTL